MKLNRSSSAKYAGAMVTTFQEKQKMRNGALPVMATRSADICS